MFPTKSVILSFGLALCVTIFSAARSDAAILLSVQQVGADVVVTGSGSAITTGLSVFAGGVSSAAVLAPHVDALTVGPAAVQLADDYRGVTGPSSFGSGPLTFASSGTGQRFGLDASGTTLLLQVPAGYISGAVLAGVSTYLNSTFSSLGITAGTYVYNFGSGPTADTLTIQVGPSSNPSATPEGGTTLLLLLSAMAGLALVQRFLRGGTVLGVVRP